MRFYFTFIFGKTGTISRIGEEQYYNRNISSMVEQFISRRFEGVTLQYFHRAVLLGKYPDVDDFGSYWYDDPATKTNVEFDCVIRRGEQFVFYECKYFDRPMALEECREEKAQLDSIKGICVSGAGFVCTGGFAFDNSNDFNFIDGKALYFDT